MEESFKEPKEVKKIIKKCTCNEDIGRNIRCPIDGDLDKI